MGETGLLYTNGKYRVKFTEDYRDYEGYTMQFWKDRMSSEGGKKNLAICQEWGDKWIGLEDIPKLIAATGSPVIVSDDGTVEVYNGYRE